MAAAFALALALALQLPVPVPPVSVASELPRPKGAPAPMETGAEVRDVGEREPPLESARLLPVPTEDELRRSGKAMRELLPRIAALGPRVTRDEVRDVFPKLAKPGVWMSDGFWPVRAKQGRDEWWDGDRGRREVSLGAALVLDELPTIRAREVDYAAYFRFFSGQNDSIYPAADSYLRGVGEDGDWVAIDTYVHAPGQFGCGAFAMQQRHVTHRQGEMLVIDRWDRTDETYWMAGRDEYREVVEGDEVVGYLIVTQLGFDVRSCLDGGRHVREAVKDNLRYMAGATKR